MMQTNVDGVFAGGDVAMFPLSLRSNKKVNVPHWQMAHMHGKTRPSVAVASASLPVRLTCLIVKVMFSRASGSTEYDGQDC